MIETSDPDFRTMKEELFGPVVTAFVYDDSRYEDTLDLVDSGTSYGLTGAVFARDLDAIERTRDRLRYAAGNFYVNDKPTGAVVGQQPFGGARASGTNDKAGSMWNLIRWVSPRAIKETFVPPRGLPLPVPRARGRRRPVARESRHGENRRGASERRHREHNACRAYAERPRDRAVEQARGRPEAEKRNAPERHDPPALLLLDRKLQPTCRGRVRGEVAEAGDRQEHEAEREPAREREGEHPAAEQKQREHHPPARAGDAAGEQEGGEDGARTEGADDETGLAVGTPERAGERRRLRVHRVGAEADHRDDEQEREQFRLRADEPQALP